MSETLWEMFLVLSGVLSTFFSFRFFNRMLVAKFPPLAAYFAMLLFAWLYSCIGTAFGIGTTMIGGALYFYIGDLLSCILIFRGTLLKKVFFAAFITSGYTGLSYSLLPLTNLFPHNNQAVFQTAYIALIYSFIIVWGVLLEWIGRRLRQLKQELPTGLTCYLLFVTVFVFITTVMITDFLKLAERPMWHIALFSALLALGGTLVVVFAIFTMDRKLSHRLSEQSTLMQLENLKEKEDYWQRLASFRHDIKNHMSCLESQMKGGKNEQALSYLDTLTDTVKQLDNRIATGNEFADAIINEKMAVMAEKNIVFTEDISLPEKCRLEPVELCCILSNTLDNATQACEQIDGERWIKAQAFIRQSQLIIIIENSIEVPKKSKALPSYSHAERGIGLLNVRTVVEKYGGAMEVSRDKTFVFSAMLPMD